MPALRSGITTGACAAAAAKAAAMVLAGEDSPREVSVTLGGGQVVTLPLVFARIADGENFAAEPMGKMPMPLRRAVAAVRKDAGDDPDVTNGLEVVVTLWPAEGGETVFLAGEGVGMVTKPGLQIAPGEAAINPGPRRMIAAAIAEVTARAMCVEVAIPGGREVAARTYNPQLGIVGGLSVLGTTGIVRPYCKKAMLESLKCALDVAFACGVRSPVIVPGNIGAKAAGRHFRLADEQVIEVGNEWGFIVEALRGYAFGAIMVAGHPGKLAKLVARPFEAVRTGWKACATQGGDWDTHSARSGSAVSLVAALAQEMLGRRVGDATTTEGVFASLGPAERRRVGDELARRVRLAVCERIEKGPAGETPATRMGDAPPACMGGPSPRCSSYGRASGTPMLLTGKMPVLRDRAGETPARRAAGTAATRERTGKMPVPHVAVMLVDMSGAELGRDGDFSPWA